MTKKNAHSTWAELAAVQECESGTPDALLQLIDEYLSNVLSFVEKNQGKTALKLEKKS
jgi:hypothetical protein